MWPSRSQRAAWDKRALAGDLFSAGYETEALAWIWGEPAHLSISEEVLDSALAEIGVARFGAEWLYLEQCREGLRDFLDGRCSLATLSRSLYSNLYYDVETLFVRALASHIDEFDRNDAQDEAKLYAERALPLLDAAYEDLVAQVAEHLRAIGPNSSPGMKPSGSIDES